MTSDLVKRVEDTLVSPTNSPWFPALTAELTEVGWSDLHRDIGLLPSNYGTARVMTHDVHTSLRVVARLNVFPNIERGNTIQIESLDRDLVRRCDDVTFYTSEEIINKDIYGHVKDAINVLRRIPSLLTTVASLVRSIHLIKPEDDEYDISFSEIHIPFSIFVSVPQEPNRVSALRVAEAVLHEAMHLQLTFIERLVPLVNLTDRKYYSPWRQEYRTAQGVLHALYVFRVIDNFLAIIAETCSVNRAQYIGRRRDEIAEQIDVIRTFRHCPELTPIGVHFVRNLL